MNQEPQAERPAEDDVRSSGTADAGAPTARRAFLRSFSRDAIQRAAEAAGLAMALQRESGAAIAGALGLTEQAIETTPGAPANPDVQAAAMAAAPEDGPTEDRAGTPAPYRVEDDALVLLDQQRYPWDIAELRCTTASEIAAAMIARQVLGAPLLAQVTAYGLWLAALGVTSPDPVSRRNRVRAMGAAFRSARSNVATIDWAAERMVAALDRHAAAGGDAVSFPEGMRAAADAIAVGLVRDLSQLNDVGAAEIPEAKGERLEIVTRGSTGRLAGEETGTVLGIVERLVAVGRPVHVWLLETHPADPGSRLAAWELAGAGIPTSLVGVDGAAWLLATRPIDVALVGADGIARDGTTTAAIGTYGLAALAAQHGVPVWVASPLAAVVSGAAPGEHAVDAEPYAVADADRPPSTAPRARSRGPLQDVTPAHMVDAFVTEAGVLRAPFAETIQRAVAEAEPD